MTKPISRHKDRGIDPTGHIAHMTGGMEEEEVETMTDAGQLGKLEKTRWIEVSHDPMPLTVTVIDPSNYDELLSIAYKLLVERNNAREDLAQCNCGWDEKCEDLKRLHEGICEVVNTEYGRLNFERQLLALIGEKW